MAASFDSASSQRLLQAATPITTYPFTVGCWFAPVATGVTATIVGISDITASSDWFAIEQRNTNSFGIVAQTSFAGGSTATTGALLAAGRWAYVVARFISSTNRRIAGLSHNNLTHGQDVVDLTPAGIDEITLGCLEVSTGASAFINARVAEFWYTKTDIQADGAQLQDGLLSQLAYGGPFSVPHIAKDIIEYRSLRVHPDSRGDQIGEVFHGALGRRTWSNVNGVTTAAHPPLPYWYVKPGQRAPLIRRAAPVDPPPKVYAAFSIPQDVGRLRARMMGY